MISLPGNPRCSGTFTQPFNSVNVGQEQRLAYFAGLLQ